MKLSQLAAFAAIVSAITACGAVADQGNHASTTADAGPGATPTPDGAPGVCCPPSKGGCAFEGGYHADGTCPTYPNLCDGMCDQRFVDDEHGCSRLVYRPCNSQGQAPVSSSSSTPSNPGSSKPPICSYPPVSNPKECPAKYSFSYYRQPCPIVGIECWYPGAGDGTSDGCFSTALLKCVPAVGDADAGPDGGTGGGNGGQWIVAQ